ncbi:hypothetical protein ACN47A_10305 [Myxococcus fulvus]|uniref:hypothetical protein n=1 Tax=Myxococcus fulvus TaxID=33 RepID=UPI003B9A7202
MSGVKISVVPIEGSELMSLVKAARQVLQMSLADIRRRDESSALAEFVLHGNDHPEVAQRLKGLLKALEQQGVRYRMYELAPEESLEDVVRREEVELSLEQVERLLQAHEDELARQRESGLRGER